MGFEDLQVWKRSARLSSELYKALGNCSNWGFRDQITRSGLSIPSNISEGYDRDSNREKIRFFSIAKGSCGELRTQTYIGIEAGFIEREQGLAWVNETKELSRMIAALIKHFRDPPPESPKPEYTDPTP